MSQIDQVRDQLQVPNGIHTTILDQSRRTLEVVQGNVSVDTWHSNMISYFVDFCTSYDSNISGVAMRRTRINEVQSAYTVLVWMENDVSEVPADDQGLSNFGHTLTNLTVLEQDYESLA